MAERGRRARAFALMLGVATLLVAVLLPRAGISWLRRHYAWFDYPMGWMQMLTAHHVNLVHGLLFAWIAATWALLRPLASRWAIAAWLLAAGIASELVQFAVPGRHPRWLDLAWDGIGIGVGLLVAARFAAPRVVSGSPARDWLARCLRGEAIATKLDASTLVVAAIDEGVVVQVQAALPTTAPAPVRDAFAQAARTEAARSLAHLAESRRVLDVLAQANVDTLVLKGTALGAWLYASPAHRACGDLDVLVATRGDADRAVAALVAAGFSVPWPTIAGDLVAYEIVCLGADRGDGASEVDLHWQAINSALYGRALGFDELRAGSIALPGLGAALGLSPVHALLHACLHRAVKLQSGGGDRLRLLMDLRLLAARLDDMDWALLVGLAIERGAAGACADGLAAAVEVGAKMPAIVTDALADAARRESIDVPRLRDWFYAQRATAAALPTWRLRMRWWRQRVFPDQGYLREYYGDAGTGWGSRFAAHLRHGWRALRR